jgi:hypothetical protein
VSEQRELFSAEKESDSCSAIKNSIAASTSPSTSSKT